MQGLHLTADMRHCAPIPAMIDPAALRQLCVAAVAQAGLHAVGELFHRFAPPGGITGGVLLAESHLAVHTWPEIESVTLDVYVCNLGQDNTAKAQALLDMLMAAFAPSKAGVQRLVRGQLDAQA
jgi:S-adenosylmethionine decarboxylase